MSRNQLMKELAQWLAPFVSGCEIAMNKSVLYAVPFDDDGQISLGVDDAGEPVRGGGTGFEQDILVFERVQWGGTSIIPRVIAKVKFGGVTTDETIVYSEKACRIRTVYPFVRYGLVLGEMDKIPARVLRLGQEFDFITLVSYPMPQSEIEKVGNLFREELQASRDLGAMLSGRTEVATLWRSLRATFK